MSAGKQKRGSVLEEKIEAYLVEQVELYGGMCEKFTSPGKRFVPDRIITWPALGFARIHFIECKTIGGRLEPGQARDHERRRQMGAYVGVMWTKKQIDEYVQDYAAVSP